MAPLLSAPVDNYYDIMC